MSSTRGHSSSARSKRVFRTRGAKPVEGHLGKPQPHLEAQFVGGALPGLWERGEHRQPPGAVHDGLTMRRPLRGAFAGPLPVGQRPARQEPASV